MRNWIETQILKINLRKAKLNSKLEGYNYE